MERRLIKHVIILEMKITIIKQKQDHITNACTLRMHDLPFTYLAATQHLWHHAWACEYTFMALKQQNTKQTCEIEVLKEWKYGK